MVIHITSRALTDAVVYLEDRGCGVSRRQRLWCIWKTEAVVYVEGAAL